MVKQIVGDLFETLGNSARKLSSQFISGAKKIGSDVAREIGLQPRVDIKQVDGGNNRDEDRMNDQVKRLEESDKKKVMTRYKQIQEEIKALEQKRQRELQDRKVSFQERKSSEACIRQIEVKKEEELPPLPVQKASKKAEMFRGVSG